MSHTYIIIKEHRLIVQNHIGPFNGEDMKRVKLKIIEDPDFEQDFNFLVDLRDSEINMTSEELIEYENWLLSHPILGKIEKFALFTNTPQQFEIALDYISKAGIRVNHYEIFRTLGDTLKWLNIDQSNKLNINNQIKEMNKTAVSI